VIGGAVNISHHKIRVFPKKEQHQSFIRGDSLFSTGRNIASDSAEEIRTFWRSKTSGDLLVNLCHPQVSFTLVICEGYSLTIHETKYIFFKVF
jgi:hypothetical protein